MKKPFLQGITRKLRAKFDLQSSAFKSPSSAFNLPSFHIMFNLRDRTKSFALRIVKLYTSLPKITEAQVLGKQVLRSGTSVGAHYREATRARSNAEYISKIEVGLQELEESIYWLELLTEAGIVKASNLANLIQEAEELIAIFRLFHGIIF